VGLGLMDYGARYYHPGLGRFISADTIVPGAASGSGGGLATIGYSEQTRLTPLAVGFQELRFLGQLASENRELLQFGPPAQWDRKTRQKHTVPMGPVNPQALNRYAYCLNNPLRYVDPTGHDSGGNDIVGYDQVKDEDGNPLRHDGKTMYVVWYFEERLVVTSGSSDLSDFKRYADNYADAWSDIGVGSVSLVAAGLTGLGACVS